MRAISYLSIAVSADTLNWASFTYQRLMTSTQPMGLGTNVESAHRGGAWRVAALQAPHVTAGWGDHAVHTFEDFEDSVAGQAISENS